jgi:thiosulfate dehydrogenase [quinone] large subunit
MKTRNPFSDVSSAASRLPLVALLFVQAVIGYEWLNSAFTKIVRGGFNSGLGEQLAKNSDAAPSWYVSILSGVVIPHAAIFGYLVEAGELLVGAGLVSTAAFLLVRGQHLNAGALRTVLAVVVLAAAGGAFMNANFALSAGDTPIWSLGDKAYSEGVTIDNMLMFIQLSIAGVGASLIYATRESRAVRTVSFVASRRIA